MLLTITTTHRPATDLGYLLHKHPDNVRTVTFPFGDAHVFFPEATDERCTAALLVEVDPVRLASCAAAVAWWDALVAEGCEGMVVKPYEAVVAGPRGTVQPGIKVRGPEYLRIVYGPEYRRAANLDRLRQRSLGRKRSLAQRELALGLEALDRFVAGEPLYRVHECVFGVLALESEPVDPRL